MKKSKSKKGNQQGEVREGGEQDSSLMISLPPELATAMKAASEQPEQDEHWATLEAQAAELQRPDDVAALYRQVLKKDLPGATALHLAERAVRFHDEWFPEPEPLIEVLTKMLEIEPESDSAFERLSMIFTGAERWDDLLALYDRILGSTADRSRRTRLLDEAAHTAKDFAGQPDRAIGYLQQLFEIKPTDGQLATSLERLFERQSRYDDLIRLWNARVAVLPRDAAQATRARIASCWFDQLHNAEQAVDVATGLVGDPAQDAPACALLERVIARDGVDSGVRTRALAALRERYAALGRVADIVRVLGSALAFVAEADRPSLHREVGERLVELGRAGDAVESYAALLALDPADASGRARLEELAAQTGRHDRLADALARAADVTPDEALRTSLLVQAGTVRCDLLGDEAGAIAVFARVLASADVPTAVALPVVRRQTELLSRAERRAELLDALERRAEIETDADARRDCLGRAARLAHELGDVNRALRAWGARLRDLPADLEALDATVEIQASESRWPDLIATLRHRSSVAPSRDRLRADLVRIASVQADHLEAVPSAIETWQEVATTFGEDADTVDALSGLLSRAGRWSDLTRLLERAVESERSAERRATLLQRLGDVFREHLDQPESAVGFYRSAIDIDPRNHGARGGLRALIGHSTVGGEAVETLARAYATVDEWEQTLEILEDRVTAAAADHARTSILLEAAGLHEHRASDLKSALICVARAFPLSQAREDVERELLRLASSTDGWGVAVRAYGDAIPRLDAAQEQSRLWFARGTLLEERVSDNAGALEAFRHVNALDPSRVDATEASIRNGARTGQWSVVADAWIECARTLDRVVPEIVARIEALADENDAWATAANVLGNAVSSASGLSARVSRELETQAALWHRDRLGSLDAAEAALLRAVEHDRSHAPTLRMLAELQRRAPGRPLVATLLLLGSCEEQDLDSLHEAAAASLDVVGDVDAARPILERLLVRAQEAWRGAGGDGNAAAQTEVAWALERLVTVHAEHAEHARAIELLMECASLPFDAETRRGMRHRAAEIAAGPLGDASRSSELYRGILAEAPGDARAIERLAAIYSAGGQRAELLALRRHELSLAPPLDRRLSIRLDMARVHGELGEAEPRAATLRENLAEQPGHPESIAEISRVLEAEGAFGPLADVLDGQANALELQGDPASARELWARLAEIAEAKLQDLPRAIAAWRRAVAIEPRVEAFDALARLHTGRNEHAAAVGWLEQRLEVSAPSERAATVVRLAQAQLGAGRLERALDCLERALADDPNARNVRDLLAEQYRRAARWQQLAQLLTDGAEFVDEAPERLARLREAADIHLQRLDSPSDAIPLLERATELAPDDRTLQTTIADAFRAAGRLDDAQAILDRLIEAYGRRRPPERANVHYQLARIARVRADHEAALAQLDIAAGIDMGHAEIHRMLGDVAREAGQLERAERAYRKLLLIVRRHPPVSTDDPRVITASEVLLELYRIALQLDQPDRAAEVLESAFETAAQNPIEAIRLERALRAEGKTELLLRALQARLSNVTDDNEASSVLQEIAAILVDELGRVDEALDACLGALTRSPESEGLHDTTRQLAARCGRVERYADAVSSLVERARASGDGALVARLLLRLGRAYADDLAKPEKAAECFGEAERMGEGGVELWRAIEKIYRTLGNRDGEMRVLTQLANADGDDPPAGERTDAIYRRAELQLVADDTRGAGIDSLSWAVDREPRYEVALELLEHAAAQAPNDDALLGLYDRVARAAGDDAALLRMLERRSVRPDATIDTYREAVEVALRLGENAREEALLRGAIAFARASERLGDAAWALVSLAERRRSAGDFGEAMDCLREAAEVGDPGDATQHLLEAAGIAAGAAERLDLAAELYERLLERDPGERNVWAPLLDVTRRRGDHARLQTLIASTLENVFDPKERNELRMERARLLMADDGRLDDATTVLREVLEEDPDHTDAAAVLADVYTRTGRMDELAEHLSRQFDAATDRGDGAASAVFARKIASLYGEERRVDVVEVYRRAIAAGATEVVLLRDVLGLLGPDDDASLRGDSMERLLAQEEGDAAAMLALDLAAVREGLEDLDGIERALSLGYRQAPASASVRDRLEQWYSGREAWAPLAELMIADAAVRPDVAGAVERMRSAAALYADRLADAARAAAVLGQACALAPADVGLLAEYIRATSQAGDTRDAIERLATVIDDPTHSAAMRADLLALRAELLTVLGDDAGAVTDLEEAYSLGGTGFARDLAAALGRSRLQALQRGDAEAERAITMRLVDVLSSGGDGSHACDVLAEWVERSPRDLEALYSLANLSASAERWDIAAGAWGRLIEAETGTARNDATIAFADAWERAGSPEEARPALEAVYAEDTTNVPIRNRLRALYELTGAWRELVHFMIEDAEAAPDEASRHERLRKAGETLIHDAGDPGAAIEPLERAMQLKPNDHMTMLLLADAYTGSGNAAQAQALLEPPINALRGRRTRELAALQHRMSHVAQAVGDEEAHLAWLEAALECDMQSGPVASELSELAMSFGKFEIALKALRALTLMKSPMPMTRAMAYLRQGMIMHRQGDAKRAAHMAKKALQEDAHLDEAHGFLREIGAE